jgi:hypothetical protein
VGSTTANGRDPQSCLGRVFNFKFGRSSVMKEVHGANVRTCLMLKHGRAFVPLA